MDDSVAARFIPECESLTAESKGVSLSSLTPSLSLALSSSYPLIIILNRILGIITWTNDDLYLNVTIVCCYAITIRFWYAFSHFLLEIMLAFCFCDIVWIIKQINRDLTPNPPTLEEIVDASTNLRIRFRFLINDIPTITHNQTWKLLTGVILEIPLQYLIVNRLMGLQNYVLMYGILFLTYYSPWAMALRGIFYRSVTVRKAWKFLIGVDFNSKKPIVRAPTIKQVGKTRCIRLEVSENQRRWLGVGWSNELLPWERQHYTNDGLEACAINLNGITPHGKYAWMDETWKVSTDLGGKDGWIYYDNYWTNGSREDGLTKFTRSRWLYRRAVIQDDCN